MGFFGLSVQLTDGEQGGERGTEKNTLHPLHKFCYMYPKMMKLGTVIPYLKKSKKYTNPVTHSLSSPDISIFHWKLVNFAISRNTDID